MKRILPLVLSVCISMTCASQVSILWSQTYTSTGNNIDRSVEMVMDGSGNVYVTGIGRGTSNFDIVTIKYNSAGVQQWISTFNGSGNGLDEGRGIALDAAGNVYVVGWSYATNYDYVTIKYNGATGGQVWARYFNGTANSTDDPYDIQVDAGANVYVTGGTNSTGTGEDYGTVKYDSAGTQQWIRLYSFTGANIDKARAMYIDNTNNIYVTGLSTGSGSGLDYATLKYDAAGTALWGTPHRYNGTGNNDDEATALTVDNLTGNVYITGYSRNTVIIDYDIATIMVNSSGTQQWAMRYGGTAAELDRGNDIVVDAAGNCYVGGKAKNSTTNEDLVVLKYDNAGALQWNTVYSGFSNYFDEAKSLVLNPAGTFLYVGGATNFGTTLNDLYTLKLQTGNGSVVWGTRFNGAGNGADLNFDIAIDAQENVYVTGQTTGTGSGSDFITIKYCQLLASAGADDSICLNASVQLNASAPGATAYSWSPASGLSNTTIANPIANPTVTTTYVVTITNANGCTDSDTLTITVFPLPGPSITPNGPTTFCAGGSVTLSGPANFNYLWAPGGQTTQSINVTSSNTYTLTITDTNTCAAQSTQMVTVNPLPSVFAGLDDSICLSQNAPLNATGAQSYLWSPSGTLSNPSIANPVAGPVTNTTYTVVGTDGNGCTNLDSVSITVNANPPVPTVSYNSITGILTCNQAGYYYQWYSLYPSVLIPGATQQTYMPVQNDTFYVEIIDNLGCFTSSDTSIVINVGITEYGDPFSAGLYPNPNNGSFIMHFSTGMAQQMNVQITDVSGRALWSRSLGNVSGEMRETISVAEFACGMYLLRLQGESGETVLRFSIQR
ncbi:MAG: SBBP repeat-containing protein [Bacteroidia bacterium]|nr:SBBP repeat-containing protein [Bacteroidia bacterium]